MLSKSIFRSLTLGSFVLLEGAARGQVPTVLSPRLHLVRASSVNFEALREANFSGPVQEVKCCGQLQTKGALVIVANDSQYPVRALVLRWTVMGPDGSKRDLFTRLLLEPNSPALMPGRNALLAPKTYALVAPTSRQVSQQPGQLRVPYQTPISIPKEDLQALDRAVSVSVGIDAAIFGNGALLGPDTTGIAQAFVCEQRGAVSAAVQVLHDVEQGVGLAEALKSRSLAVQGAQGNSGSGCAEAQAREFTRLALHLESEEAPLTVQDLERLSTRPVMRIHRMGQN